MKRNRILSWIFAALAVLLSDVMCAVVAADYTNLVWCGKTGGCSAPPEVAFCLSIPFLLGIIVCAGLAWFFHRK